MGFALVSLAMHQELLRCLRAAAVGGAFLAAGFLLELRHQSRDRLLLPLVAMLCGLGLIVLWRVNPDEASRQVLWVVLGLAAMVGTYLLLGDVRNLARYKYTAGALALGLLVLTMVIGHETNGARLWLDVGGLFVFQPTEVAKILMCLFLAGYVADRGDVIRAEVASRPKVLLAGLRYMGPLLLVVIFFLAASVVQRDLGAAALFFGLFVAVTYLATGRKTYALVSLFVFIGGMVAAYYVFGHVHQRFDIWVNPWADKGGAGYQSLQGLYALGAGGLSGTGLGRGFPHEIPVVSTDLIYAAVGEELGLLGTLAMLLLYALISVRSYLLGARATHPFAALLATCLATVFALQTLIIVGGVLRLIPLTGITMPFVSYGGSSITANFIALGLLLAVSRDSSKVPD